MNTFLHAGRARGFSLVELMVSIVIGLLALMFATKVITGSEQNKEASLGGSDSMQNGMVALFSINADAAQSGWGLNDPLVAGCDTVFSDTSGYTLATTTRTGVTGTVTPLASAVIQFNGSAPDQLTFYSGSSMSGTGTVRITTAYSSGSTMSIDRIPYGFNVNDVIVVAPETQGASKCALAQLTSVAPVSAQQTLTFASGTGSGYRYNAGNLGVAFAVNQARIYNLGPATTLNFHTWSVNSGFLQLRATNLGGASAAATTVIDNVVSIKAEYGFDTRSGAAFLPESGMQISQWSAGMIDADGDGTTGGATDYQRIAALRIAVIARSKIPEKPAADGTCSTTPTAPTIFATSEPSGVTAVPLTPSVAVAGDATSWQCYRYRVFETIVPLRNSGWRPTA